MNAPQSSQNAISAAEDPPAGQAPDEAMADEEPRLTQEHRAGNPLCRTQRPDEVTARHQAGLVHVEWVHREVCPLDRFLIWGPGQELLAEVPAEGRFVLVPEAQRYFVQADPPEADGRFVLDRATSADLGGGGMHAPHGPGAETVTRPGVEPGEAPVREEEKGAARVDVPWGPVAGVALVGMALWRRRR